MGAAYDWTKDHAGEIGADLATGGLYSAYKATTGQNSIYNSIPGIGSGLNALTPASPAGVQQAASDAQNIQNQFLAQYSGLQPNQAPTMNAANVRSVQANAAPAIAAAQMQGSQLNGANLGQDRNAQMALAQSLQGTISGTQPSVAQLQQQQAFGQLAAQQAGLAAAAGRGGNQALAMRTAMQNQGNLGAQAASQGALLRAQEIAQAQGQLGGVISTAQGADLSQASQNAQLSQAAAQQNASLAQQAALANQGNTQAANLANANAANAALSQGSSQQQAASAANQQAALTNQQQFINQQANLGQLTNTANANQVNAQVGALNAQTAQKAQTANLISTGAGLAALSDQRAKQDIHSLEPGDVAAFLESIRPAAFRYKPGMPAMLGDGSVVGREHAGVMAQDLERSPMGRTLVKQTPGGAKVVDFPAATMANTAALADIFQRIKRLEGRR